MLRVGGGDAAPSKGAMTLEDSRKRLFLPSEKKLQVKIMIRSLDGDRWLIFTQKLWEATQYELYNFLCNVGFGGLPSL